MQTVATRDTANATCQTVQPCGTLAVVSSEALLDSIPSSVPNLLNYYLIDLRMVNGQWVHGDGKNALESDWYTSEPKDYNDCGRVYVVNSSSNYLSVQ